jgi:tetratricopeptide (TPR) repeat protein
MRRILRTAGVCCGCALWLASAAPVVAAGADGAAGGPAPLLAEGRQLLAQGQGAAAEAVFRRLVARYPALADGHDGLARALAAQGRDQEAAAILVHLGEGWLQGGDYPEAAGTLRRAAALAPESATAHALLGRALVLDQAFAEGASELARAVELGERGVVTRTLLASAWWEDGRLAEAEALLRALAAETGAVSPRHQLGRLLLWEGRYEEAAGILTALARGLRRAPDVELDLAEALEGAGRRQEALAAYRRVAAWEPGRSTAHYRLALLLGRGGEAAAAAREMATFDRLYREEQERVRNEGLARARLERGWELLRGGRAGEAAEHFAALPETVESLRGLALSYAASGRHAEAVSTLERAVSLAPDQGDLRLLLADERLRAGEPR